MDIPRPASLETVGMQLPVIAPSMLKCDFGHLAREVELLERAQAKVLHLDVMDGHFVPNLSYGPPVIERLRKYTDLPFDAHLMISDPAKYLDEFVRAGCQWITFHIEAVPHPAPLLRRIRQAGCGAGISLNPDTPVAALKEAVGECDVVLVMSVQPGFGGQAFQPKSLEKVRQVRDLFGPDVFISIDGGIGPETIGPAAAAGAQVFVCGSSIFDQPNYETAISQMRQLAVTARSTQYPDG